MKKTLFSLAALLVASLSASAQPEGVTAHAPVVPWGAQAETIITNDLTQQNASGGWELTADAQKWIQYSYDGEVTGAIQQTNRPNVWFDFYDESTDTMVIAADHNWGGYLTVTSKTGSTSGLMVVGKNRYPAFYVTNTDKAKFYFSGSAGTAGRPQIEVYEADGTEPIATKTGDIDLTKSTWDKSTLLIADGLDKAKTYKIVARTMNAEGAYEGGDIVLQVVKIYGDQAPLREDGVVLSGSELGGYINAHLAAYPEVTDFTLEGNGKYTITEGITAAGKFTLTGVAAAPATIDASALAAPFVQFAEIAEDAEKDENGFVAATNVKFENVKVTGLAQSLFSSNKQNYLVPELTINNSVVALAGNPFVVDFRNGGLVAKLAVSNSTVWAAEATGNSFYTGQSGKKATEAGLEEQVFSFTNNTLSNICFGKNFFTHRQNGQTWLTFEVKDNIIVNCGKDNFLASLNGGQASANPKYTVENNTFLKTVTETAEDETTTEVLSNINDAQTTSDEAEGIVNPVAGVPFTLANALTGNFTVAANSQQAKFKVGDARWLVPYATEAFEIEVDAENPDFAAAINAKLAESELPSQIKVTFYEAGEYPTTAEINTNAPITFQVQDIDAGEATIVANHGMTLGGATIFNGVNIDATALETPVITLQGNEYKLQDNGFYNLGSIQFKNLAVKGIKNALVAGNKVKNLINELLVENSTVELESGSNVPFNFNGGGVVGSFNIKKSTIWAPEATSNSLYTSQSGNKATEAGLTVQNFSIDNSTLYNIATGKNFYTHRQSNQTWLAYYLRNSLFINVGKAGQVVKGINQGQSGKNPKWTVSGNLFATVDAEGNFVDQSANESTGDEDEPVQNSVAFISAEFAGIAEGNFDGTVNVAEETTAAPGDPRWTITFVVPATHTWDFTQWSAETVANLLADAAASKTEGWSDVEKQATANDGGDPTELSKDNCFWFAGTANEDGSLSANGIAIKELEGLKFLNESYNSARSLAIAVNYQDLQTYDAEGNVTGSAGFGPYNGPAYLWLGGKAKEIITIVGVKGGSKITIGVESHKLTDARGLQLLADGVELKDAEGNAVAAPTTYTEQTWQAPEETGNVVIKNTNGCHIYFIDAEIDESYVGIQTVENFTATYGNGAIYNLNGQKVSGALTKGLYIMNGKKFIVK